MNEKLAKKMRKYSKRPWIEYVNMVCQWPLSHRLRLAWYIVWAKGKKKEKKR